MKKILILSSDSCSLYNTRFELIEKLIEEDFKVHIIAPEALNDKKVILINQIGATYNQININRRGMNIFEDLKLIRNIKNLIKSTKPDIILTFTIKPNIYGSYAANKFNTPVIMNITGLGSSLVTGKLKNMIKLMYRYACSKSTKVFFQNDSNLDFFLSNNLVDEKKTELIPGSGVNIEKFKPLKKTIEDNKVKFIFIGRLMQDKGIEEYLEVAENITKIYPYSEFQILGDFEENKYRKIIKNNENKNIKYLGVSEDVRNEIREVDAIVNPSYHEGMSNILLEGAAMGKFLIASDIPGCKEIVEDGVNGFLFKPMSARELEKKILKFIKLKSEKKIYIKNDSIKKIRDNFDREIVINKYVKTINKILRL